MQISPDHAMIALVDQWAAHLGYFDNKIDLGMTDLSSFATPDCSLTAHAPLWGTKKGAEEATPVADVRRQLARLLKVGRPGRHDMHLAVHPGGDALGLFFRVKASIRFVPVTLRTIPLAFVVQATDTDDGLRINEVHEWAAADPAAACRVLVDHHAWPAGTTMEPHVAFGALS